jgi:hypothetical protein
MGSCEGVDWNSPFDTSEQQHTVCNNPLYEGLRGLRTPLRKVPQASPLPMAALGSAVTASSAGAHQQQQGPEAPEPGVGDSLDFPSGPSIIRRAAAAAAAEAEAEAAEGRLAVAPGAAAWAGSCSSSSQGSCVVRLSLDQGLAPGSAAAGAAARRAAPAASAGFSFPSFGSAGAAAVEGGAGGGASRPHGSLPEEFSFESGGGPDKVGQQGQEAAPRAAAVAACSQQAAAAAPCSPGSPAGDAGSRGVPASLRKLHKERAPMSSLISRFEQPASSDSPGSDQAAAGPLHNRTNFA